jgi:hypothetical protein
VAPDGGFGWRVAKHGIIGPFRRRHVNVTEFDIIDGRKMRRRSSFCSEAAFCGWCNWLIRRSLQGRFANSSLGDHTFSLVEVGWGNDDLRFGKLR